MFKIKFILRPDFHTESKHIISILRVDTDSFVGAVFLVETYCHCCVDYAVKYGEHKFTPQKWKEFVRANNPSDATAPIVQKSLF